EVVLGIGVPGGGLWLEGGVGAVVEGVGVGGGVALADGLGGDGCGAVGAGDGDGVGEDNLVQIADNVQVGPDAILGGQVGLGGSCKIGAGAMLGGQVGVKDNLTVGQGAMVGAQSGVMKDIPPGQMVFGTPSRPGFDTLRTIATIERLGRTVRALKQR